MKRVQVKFCKDCKHCLLVAVVDDLNPFCNNPITKELEHPIGFLVKAAIACEYFEEAKSTTQARPIALPFAIRNGKVVVNY